MAVDIAKVREATALARTISDPNERRAFIEGFLKGFWTDIHTFRTKIGGEPPADGGIDINKVRAATAHAQAISDPAERKAFIDGFLKNLWADVHEYRRKTKGAKVDTAKVKEAIVKAKSIADPVERKAFIQAFIAGMYTDLAQWRKTHPKRSIIRTLTAPHRAVLFGMGKLGEGVAYAVKKGIAFGVRIIGNAALLPLVPSIPMMRNGVKKKGLKPKKELRALAEQFYTNVIKSKYDPDHFVLGIGALVSAILGYVGKIFDKKEAGETLTPEEEKVVELVSQAKEQIKEGAKEKAATETGAFLRENMGIITAAAFLLIYMAFSGKK